VILLLTATAFAGQSKCVAHRGDSAAYLENSMAAVESAIEIGAFAVEFDVHHTSDGQPILMHDTTLARTAQSRDGAECPLNTPVHDIAFSDLMANCQLANGQDIPRLDQALAAFDGTPSIPVIELKDMPSAITSALLTERYPDGEGALVIAFDHHALDAVDAPITKLHLGVFTAKVRRYDGIDVFWARGIAARRTRARGDTLAAWTIDDPEQMTKLADFGVDYITTNVPGLCMETIQ
jgi:glycerophosphoryl diester phosphodiesterase